ncbi:hypothetical protein B0F90DRAFT_1727493 [Multifurca ochricompacta]|uniref:Uncharacterized protein n=1 Tax=Multifurca ochricompacta TaxID=376703 RepID=A0AAD4QLM8_9AGAM|nr:hypothetical protein B0F90DRAFT_1727493 [Multifurca ochricompacta]
MGTTFIVYLYRYYLFAITIVSNAIICSAAAWNLPIAQSANLPTQSHVDIYMIFLGAFSLLVVIPLVFTDAFFQRAITGHVWVECLWIDFLWLLHIVGSVLVTTLLPRDMCTPQVKSVDGNSCVSSKLILAFSWICTINLFIYLIFLVASAILHHKRDSSVWGAQVRSYPWYLHLYRHRLASGASLPDPLHRHQVHLPAPQPRRPIQLPTQAVPSSMHAIEHTLGQQRPGSPTTESRMLEARPTTLTSLYPLHIQAAWEAAEDSGPSSGSEGSANLHSPTFPQQHLRRSIADGPLPLWNWPRADIMSLPSRPTAARKKSPTAAPSSPVVEHPREPELGLSHSVSTSVLPTEFHV